MEKLSYSFDGSPCAVLVIDSEGVIAQVNESLLTLLGHENDTLTGIVYKYLLPSQMLEQYEHFRLKIVSAGKLKDIVTDIKTKSGDYLKVNLDAYAEYDSDGNYAYTICFIEPIEKGMPNYDQIFNSTTVPLLVYDSDSLEIIDVNKCACDFYGYTYDEMITMNITDINVDTKENIFEYVNQIRASEKPQKFIFKHRLKNGDIRYVDAWPSTLMYEGNNYNFTVLTDITDRYLKEQNLKAVAEMSSKLLKTDTAISDISQLVVRSVKELTAAADGYAGSIDEDTGNLIIHSFSMSYGAPLDHEGPVMFLPGEDGSYRGLWGHSLNTGEPFYTNDVANCGLTNGLPEWHVRIRNFISYPVVMDGVIVGQISAANCPHGFTDGDIKALGELAKLYAVAIHFQKEHQLETLYTNIVENTNDGITILKPDHRGDFILKFINKAGVGPAVFMREEMIGKKITELFPVMKNNGQLEVFTKVMRTGEPVYQPRMNYKDENHDVWFENYFFRLQNKYVVAIHKDITSVVKSADALAASEAKYRSYISNSPDPIIVIDDNTKILEVNEATVEKFGYTAEELMEMEISDLWPEYLKLENSEKLRKNMSEDSFKVMYPHISKSGEIFHMHAHLKKLDEGRMIGILQDLTERVHMQYELNELNADLQRRVREEIELREKQEKAMFEQKKLADMGQMMNAIAHQWRQPLNGLGLFIEYISDKYYSNSLGDADIEEFHSVSSGLIEHLSKTIDDFKDFCKPDSSPVEFEIVREISSILTIIESQLTMHNIKVKLSCECSHKNGVVQTGKTLNCSHAYTNVLGYPGEFKQAMLNIIYNAVDSMDETIAGGLVPCGELEIGIKSDNKQITVICKDNGTGIDESIMENIFDPYFTTKDEGKGTGIGLYMAKLLIEKHMGGYIHASNNENMGACFKMVFNISN